MIKGRAAAAALIAVIAGNVITSTAGIAAGVDPGSRYHGWGLAIAYLAVGEKCPGALSVEEMQQLQSFVSSGLAYSRQKDKAFDHEKFVDTFHDEMVTKYSDTSNCTPGVVKEARNAVTEVRKRAVDAD